MADIKTKQVNKGTIKTLDCASSMTHRIKDVAVSAKENIDLRKWHQQSMKKLT